MAKRVAEKELTDRNWDEEEESEEVGTFSLASEQVLKNRTIKKAKRRNVRIESESSGAFKGFKGFALSPGAGRFSGFGNGIKTLDGLSNGGGTITTATSSSKNSSFPPLKTASEMQPLFSSIYKAANEEMSASMEANGEKQPPPTSGPAQSHPGSSDAYHKQLAALNCSVSDWIVKHVNANPLCDLTPIFRDYEKYLAEIEQHSLRRDSRSDITSEKAAKPPQGSSFFFNSSRSEDSLGKSTELEKKKELKFVSSSPVFLALGKSDSNSGVKPQAASGFSFPPGNGSLFGKDSGQSKVPSFSSGALDTQTESGSSEEKGGDEEEEEPPKVVINEVKEEDAFYSKKCKVFYKKDNEFKEKGVGTLHLKPAGDQKTQLLIRADTNIGNILLNILVPPQMPCSRTGKNNVLIVCVPNPPVDEKNASVPVPLLIRVKTSEDADELHKILLEKK